MQPVSVSIESVTPILIVREIEPCLEFWKKFGFNVIAEVPHEGRLGFVMFTNGKQMLMLQSEASANADVKIAPAASGGVLYLSVPDIAAVESIVDRAAIVLPRRVTEYGATEVWVREPGGNLVGFAQHGAGQ
jgi:catechol 2,3-dioxygenase-like lactoylglutathione lyase family enzyme